MKVRGGPDRPKPPVAAVVVPLFGWRHARRLWFRRCRRRRQHPRCCHHPGAPAPDLSTQLPVYINSSFPSQTRKPRNSETTSPSGFHARSLEGVSECALQEPMTQRAPCRIFRFNKTNKNEREKYLKKKEAVRNLALQDPLFAISLSQWRRRTWACSPAQLRRPCRTCT